MAELGWDIGGTLTKLAIFVPHSHAAFAAAAAATATRLVREIGLDEQKCFLSKLPALVVPGGAVYFATMATSALELDLVTPLLTPAKATVFATGGGAHKFEAQLLEMTKAGKVEHCGEIQALFIGLDLLLRVGRPDEVFTCKNVRFAGMLGVERGMIETEPIVLQTVGGEQGFLLVNIGSGVSFVDCNGRGAHQRVGGSSLGGATFLGLVTLLCQVSSFEQALELASRGDSTLVDLLVGDIYSETGESNKRLEDLGLRVSTLAASFGKMANSSAARSKVKREDLALSVLIMISLNLAAMAYLHATIHGQRTTVLFVGSFLAGAVPGQRNTLACRTLTYGIEFWGKMRGREMQAAFLQREGYLGALGVLSQTANFAAPAPRL